MENGIQLEGKYLNIAHSMSEARMGMRSPFVYTDEDRVMQVLLGL